MTAEFKSRIDALASGLADSNFAQRWEDTQRFGSKLEPSAFWIRQTEDIVNVAWIEEGVVFDISWYPERGLSTVAFLPLSNIAGMEFREALNAAATFHLPVSGEFIVSVHGSDARASLIWAASGENAEELRAFALAVARASFRPTS